MARPGTTTQRGYGTEHQALRRALIVNAIGQLCPRCGEPMLEWQALDLGHTDDRSGYNGIEHAKCNRAAGGRKGQAGRSRSATDETFVGRW
jgi:hypothetical protein